MPLASSTSHPLAHGLAYPLTGEEEFPSPPTDLNLYYQPGGVFVYHQPDGTSLYLIP